MNDVYLIKLYDTPLVTFRMRYNEFRETKVEFLEADRSMTALVPYGFDFSDEGTERFLKERIIPKGRKHVNEILSSMGLKAGDIKGIIDISKGLSLNDSYCVLPADSDDRFDDINLFDNGFSDLLAIIAYTGKLSSLPHSASPEFSTNGTLPKAWRKIDDKICLFKGSSDSISGGKEPYSEFYCAQVAKHMGLNYTEYDLEEWNGSVASVCPLFCSKDISYIPFSKFGNADSFSEMCLTYSESGKEYLDELRSMLVFDSIIYNIDRHSNNYGFLRDNHSGKTISAAPIFDNGLSILNFESEDFSNTHNSYMPAQTPLTFDELALYSIGEKQLEQLERLQNFEIRKHGKYDLPDETLEKFQTHIRSRAGHLLEKAQQRVFSDNESSNYNNFRDR